MRTRQRSRARLAESRQAWPSYHRGRSTGTYAEANRTFVSAGFLAIRGRSHVLGRQEEFRSRYGRSDQSVRGIATHRDADPSAAKRRRWQSGSTKTAEGAARSRGVAAPADVGRCYSVGANRTGATYQPA